MYDPFIFVMLFAAGGLLIAGYLAKSIVKYPLLLVGALLLIYFGMLASSNEGFQEEIGANFHVIRDANFQVQDINMALSYVAVNASNKPFLLALGDFAYYGGILFLLLILADLALHTYRGFKKRNL